MGLWARVGLAVGAVAIAGTVVIGGIALTSGSPDSTDAESASSTVPGERPPTPTSSINPVLGTWVAPCDRIMDALIGEHFEELTCTGTYRITFAPDGAFTQRAGGTQTITSPDGDFSQTLPWSANHSTTWATEGGRMRFGTNASSPVSITPDLETEDGLGVPSLMNAGAFDFEVSSTSLTLHPTFPAIGRVTLLYDRA